MKKIILIFSLISLSLLLFSCKSNDTNNEITTTMFVQYDIANQIVANKIKVSLVTPLGIDIHNYEPTPKTIKNITNSKLFLYTSDIIEPWAQKINLTNGSKINIGDNLKDKYEKVFDSHYWTSPDTFIKMIDLILTKIIKIDPDNKNFYENNANNYKNEVSLVSNDFINYLSTKDHKPVFYIGHNAMMAFASYFNITIIPIVDDVRPDHDITAKEIVKIVNAIKEMQPSYLFIPELTTDKFIKTIQNELKSANISLDILELHGYHNLTIEDFNNKLSYLDILNNNINNLKESWKNND